MPPNDRRNLPSQRLVILFGGLFCLLLLAFIYYAVKQDSEHKLRQAAALRLTQLSNSLQAMLARHTALPAVLAEDQNIKALLETAELDKNRQQQVNLYLEKVAAVSGALDVYLMRPDGLTIAASNWARKDSFIRQNFAFRPYFQQAMRNALGRYHAVGTTSKERGYYFASPVRGTASHILGVIAVKVPVTEVESNWARDNTEFMVTDLRGIVFIASQANWLYHSLQALDPVMRSAVENTQQYAEHKITPLPDFGRRKMEDGVWQVTLNKHHYLMLKGQLAAADWEVYTLVDRDTATRTVTQSLLFASILLSVSALLIWSLWKNQQQRRLYERHLREELEAKVEHRTRELRHTQEELVQAAKMAALGQLSAGINHELNNPLTAIRAYADNAAQFIERGKVDIARGNLGEIIALTERMATITRQLKTFSRKSAGQIETCDLHRSLDSALGIVQPKLAQTRIVLEQQRADNTRYVLADQVWLEQILVNLLSNAIEAVQEQETQRIWIRLQQSDKQIGVSVCDNGPGISETAMPHVFEAFFTTKTIGKGLGLGLSISYRLARDMHGNLSVGNAPQGGAVFTLTLQQAATET